MYVVNASSKPVLHTLYSMLFREALGEDGTWRRSTPYVIPSCGVGLERTVSIPPNGFFRTFRQPNDPKGVRKKVRYREGDAITNVGEGIVDPEAIRLSRFDWLAIQTAPLEDLAPVATGEIDVGVHGEMRVRAIERLGEFVDDPRRIAVLKSVLRIALKKGDYEIYALALDRLTVPCLPSWKQEDFWQFAKKGITGEDRRRDMVHYLALFNAPYFPERKRVLLQGILEDTRHPLFKWALQQSPDAEWKRSLLEKVIANPRHPLLEWALSEFPRVAGNAPAVALVERVLASPRYGEPIKKHARALQDLLLENPYLTLLARPSEPDALGRKTISITVMNASDERLELRAKNPFELLQITVAHRDGRELPRIAKAPPKLTEEGPILLQPRDVFTFPDVHWWDFVDTRNVPPNTELRLTVSLQTPGFWKRPARIGPVTLPAASVNAARDYQRAEGVR